MLRMKRRSFLKLAAATGAAAALGPKLVGATLDREHPQGQAGTAPDATDTTVIRSTCLNCHGGCGIQCKVKGGELIKIDGNPYSSNTYDYISAGDWAKESDLDAGSEGPDLGSVCPKGAAGIYELYNPRRLLHPVKRVGARGSRNWKRISWDDAYSELVNGGNLFGEGHVDGLKAIRSDEPIGSAESDYMDEAPPDGYGPKRNQYYWMRGRNENGKSTDRWHKTYGTMAKGTHWTICEASERIITGMQGASGAMWDLKNATYVISAGANIYDSSFTMQTQARHLSKWFLRRSGTKFVYIGPRQNKAAGNSPNGEWVPIRTGTDPAFGLGMVRYIIENNLYDADSCSRPNKDAAAAGGHPASTDLTHLVSTTEPKTYTGKCSVNGVLKDVADATGPADLEASVPGASTVFTLLKARAMANTMDYYNDHCGIPSGTIERIASEFAAADKPVIGQYKGPCQQSNPTGTNAYVCVNILMNRMFQLGGSSGGGGYTHGHLAMADGGPGKKGVCPSRATATYAGSKATPTKPWFPLNPSAGGDGVQTECYAGISAGYPYKLKAMSHYRANAIYTLPRAQNAVKALETIPLLFAIDPFMNETSALSDYVLPDTTYLEHWSYYHGHPANKHSEKCVRQPVVGTVDHAGKTHTPINPDTKSVDNIHLDLLAAMGLPNVGVNADGEGNDIYNDYQMWDVYYRGEHIEHVVHDVGGHASGISPDAPHMVIGGIFGNQGDSSAQAGAGSKHMNCYLNDAAATKNSLSGAYMDGLPWVGRLVDGANNPISVDASEYDFALGTGKRVLHTQARTGQNLWLMSMQPENGLEMNPVDAARYNVDTGDWVELENWSGDKGKYKVIVTNTMRPGYGEVENSYGHWELGARDHSIDGHENGGIKGDPRIGAGFAISYIMPADPAQSGDADTVSCLNDPLGGSSEQYGLPMKVRKV